MKEAGGFFKKSGKANFETAKLRLKSAKYRRQYAEIYDGIPALLYV